MKIAVETQNNTENNLAVIIQEEHPVSSDSNNLLPEKSSNSSTEHDITTTEIETRTAKITMSQELKIEMTRKQIYDEIS